jgi:signal peptidase I
MKVEHRLTKDDLPLLQAEQARLSQKKSFGRLVLSTLRALIVSAAIAVLAATLWMPVLQVTGSSMSPTLREGNILLCTKSLQYKQGDVIAFYYGNKLLVKRWIAGPGDWVIIDESGNVYVNNELLDEPYVSTKTLGETDITFPYQVPDGRCFVLGDSRQTSMDSRISQIGCISTEQIAGTVRFRLWPLDAFGPLSG